MGIVRLRDWKSTDCHEAPVLCAEEMHDPTQLNATHQRKNSCRAHALRAALAHTDERIPGGCKHPTADCDGVALWLLCYCSAAAWFSPAPGRHQLALMDESGKIVYQIRFEVREYAQQAKLSA